jgi:hypothetical protein
VPREPKLNFFFNCRDSVARSTPMTRQYFTVRRGVHESRQEELGNSLVKTIENYRCSHVGTNATGMLIVIVSVASTDESFNTVKGSSRPPADVQKLDIADGGWLFPTDQGLSIVVLKGRAVINLDLDTQGRCAAIGGARRARADRRGEGGVIWETTGARVYSS